MVVYGFMPISPMHTQNESSKMNFYAVGNDYPWGDYGEGVIQGYVWRVPFYMKMCRDESRKIWFTDDDLKGFNYVIERLGPVVPDLVMNSSGMFVVNEKTKDALLEAFPEIQAEPLFPAKIVNMPWETWDLKAELPPVAPFEGEPEGYVIGNEHSISASEKMGTLYRLILPKNPLMAEIRIPYDLFFSPDQWKGEHFLSVPHPHFTEPSGSTTIVSEFGKNWLIDQELDKFLYFSSPLEPHC